ncbi:hypothetical protein FACS189425_08320 [Clostridia bacterium]|nr:hypothetical protein FACS189425_08320 [Clostridia bacterium]
MEKSITKKIINSGLVFALALSLSSCTKTSAPPEPTNPPISFNLGEFAKVDGSTVTIPLTTALTEAALGIPDASNLIKHNTTSQAIVNLIKGDADIIFVTYPSDAELQSAQKAGVELEIVPVVNDAFVFLVNSSNPITGLTTQQIKDIYSGKTTNWKTVGGDNVDIIAYQREVGSGSQSGMVRFMGTAKLALAPKEFTEGEMGGLVEKLAAFSSGKSAIGYSYYYYVNSMYVKDGIKLLAVDGIEPNNQTISAGEYPNITPYYIAINKNAEPNSFARRFMEYALTDRGQRVAENAGYVKVK